jgi:hypothetical protein
MALTNAERSRRWRERNPEKAAAKLRSYAAARADWSKENLPKAAEARARARSRAGRAAPWNDASVMSDLYELAEKFRSCGVFATVDHVIPLRGRLVSGLHVHTNLQLLPKHENQRKYNQFTEA